MSEASNFEKLPKVIKGKIFTELGYSPAFFKAAEVCKSWHQLTHHVMSSKSFIYQLNDMDLCLLLGRLIVDNKTNAFDQLTENLAVCKRAIPKTLLNLLVAHYYKKPRKLEVAESLKHYEGQSLLWYAVGHNTRSMYDFLIKLASEHFKENSKFQLWLNFGYGCDNVRTNPLFNALSEKHFELSIDLIKKGCIVPDVDYYKLYECYGEDNHYSYAIKQFIKCKDIIHSEEKEALNQTILQQAKKIHELEQTIETLQNEPLNKKPK